MAYRRLAQVAVSVTALALMSQLNGQGFSVSYGSQGLSSSESERATAVLGQSLSLQDLKAVTPSVLSNVITQPTAAPQALSHTVAAGETISSIAAQYGLHTGSILLANPSLQNENLITQGQVLTIPAQDASSDDLNREYQALAAKYSSVALADTPAAAAKAAPVKAVQTTVSSSAPSFILPLATYQMISQGFSSVHSGIDYATPIGTPVRAAAAGCVTVEATGWNDGYGLMIKIDHSDGFSTLYAHLSKFVVAKGTCVEQGQTIAYSGTTGRSTGPHLHFEIRTSDTPINPAPYVR